MNDDVFGTERYFRSNLEIIDALAEIDFDPSNMSIRVRPSHPRYRQSLIEAASQFRCPGIVVNVIKEVDDWIAVNNYEMEKWGISQLETKRWNWPLIAMIAFCLAVVVFIYLAMRAEIHGNQYSEGLNIGFAYASACISLCILLFNRRKK